MADIICFDKGGRDERRRLVVEGRAPRDFFYGTMDLEERGYAIDVISSALPYRGAGAFWHRALELLWSHISRLGMRPHFVATIAQKMQESRVAISFTDGFSLTLGDYYSRRNVEAPYLIGCFHGLSDFEFKAPPILQPTVRRTISRSLKRLDHVAFFGPADRQFGIERYDLDPARTSNILFGVDTEFWTPAGPPEGDYIFSIGQDPNRDFNTLVGCDADVPIRLHTALPVHVPSGLNNVVLTRGSYHRSTMTDEDLREMYRKAMAVAVPLRDVYQPTGYSVTLQAMACGKAVILSRIKGLWAPELLRDGENCLLVPPGDKLALANALRRIAKDPSLRERLGRAARATVVSHFSTSRAADCLEGLVQRAMMQDRKSPADPLPLPGRAEPGV